MRFVIRQFLGKNHSWAIVGQNIARSLLKLGHSVDLYSTDGIKYFPQDLKNNLIGYNEETNLNTIGRLPGSDYDAQFGYTALHNADRYFVHSQNNKFLQWCYEIEGKNILPDGFSKYHKYLDKVLPPSIHDFLVFNDSGIPKDKLEVFHHGIDDNFINKNSTLQLKTKKRFKILVNLGQVHFRKNLPGIFDAFGQAFTKNDDVCLVMKVSIHNNANADYDVNFNLEYEKFRKKYKNHADVLVIKDFITDMSDLYRSCNCLFSMSHAESFLMPALEGLASKLIVVVPNYGGQIDFCNHNNSLLINGDIVKADRRAYYWQQRSNGMMFNPSIKHAVEQLQNAYKYEIELKNKFATEFDTIRNDYTWDNTAKQLIGLCK